MYLFHPEVVLLLLHGRIVLLHEGVDGRVRTCVVLNLNARWRCEPKDVDIFLAVVHRFVTFLQRSKVDISNRDNVATTI